MNTQQGRSLSLIGRVGLCLAVLSTGIGAQAALEYFNETDRPPLRAKLSTIPMELGDWVGHDEPVDSDIVERSQTTEYLNRVYENKNLPGLRLTLWINYSSDGLNLRHTPEICLPSSGWSKVESQTKELELAVGQDRPITVTRLGYSRDEMIEHVGFWYYIFGEGKLENLIRQLPITSRSSHGRTTRGSSMTVEVFYPGENDDGASLATFAEPLVKALEPILPQDRATYHIP